MNASRTLAGLVGLVTLVAQGLPEGAAAQERTYRRPPRSQVMQSRPKPPPAPMLAVVGLREQRISIYDATGARMLDAPVSSGARGYETPPGVFSVVQKEPDHHSNLYDDASMPYMQRLTWTGIALHAGALPGYAASHGCVRLPYDFAERLYGLTRIGMRVVVAREGIAPVAIAEPAMFKRKGVAEAAGASALPVQLAGVRPDAASPRPTQSLAVRETEASALARNADDAARRVAEERMAVARAKAAAQPAERDVQRAAAALASAEAGLKAAEKLIEAGAPPKRLADAQKVVADAPARIAASRAQLDAVQAAAKARLDAVTAAEEKLAQAQAAHTRAVAVADNAKQSLAPVSVFVSRKTQRIYIRKAFHPLWEGPVSIRDADKPIGTFVFTALEPEESSTDLRWNVVSLYRNPTAIEPATARPAPVKRGAAVEMQVTNPAAAQAALDRLVVPADLAQRISETVLPGSSLVISDEPASIETGKDTDFVVIMSGEPQGGIAIRQHAKPERSDDYDDRYARRQRRSGGSGIFGSWFD